MERKQKSSKTATAKTDPKPAPRKGLRDKTIYPAWDCAVVGGEVVIRDREAFERHLIPYEGKENLQLILKRRIKARSRLVERYYHAVPVRMIADEMQISDEEAHEMLKGMFLKVEERAESEDGKSMRYERVMSTTELGDKRYYEYVFEQVVRWAALPTKDDGLGPDSGLGLYIPLPNEAEWDGREEYAQFINR